jgi:hypothetical protein
MDRIDYRRLMRVRAILLLRFFGLCDVLVRLVIHV